MLITVGLDVTKESGSPGGFRLAYVVSECHQGKQPEPVAAGVVHLPD